jgi:hypothetical protein
MAIANLWVDAFSVDIDQDRRFAPAAQFAGIIVSD